MKYLSSLHNGKTEGKIIHVCVQLFSLPRTDDLDRARFERSLFLDRLFEPALVSFAASVENSSVCTFQVIALVRNETIAADTRLECITRPALFRSGFHSPFTFHLPLCRHPVHLRSVRSTDWMISTGCLLRDEARLIFVSHAIDTISEMIDIATY